MGKLRSVFAILIGFALTATGIILAVFSSTIEEVSGSKSLEVTAYRGGNLMAIVGICLVFVGYLELRARRRSYREK